MPANRNVFGIEPRIGGITSAVNSGIILYHTPFFTTRLLLDKTERSGAEMPTKKCVSFINGIRTRHATSRDFASEVFVDEGRIKIGGGHIRGYESGSGRRRIADRRAKRNVVHEIRVSFLEVKIT